MPRSGLVRPVLAILLTLAIARGALGQDHDVPYFPTPQPAVEKMLEMAGIKSGDFLIDLGSGDGRIPITAAKRHGIRALGVDLDPALNEQARAAAVRENVSDKVTFREQDLFDTDLSEATVITLFLLGSVNMKLRPRLMALKPGTRILSYGWSMGEWKPDATAQIDGRTIHMWIVRGGATTSPSITD
ncbi:MAG: class I SAM-dependent methyltransferase [Rhizobiales bacterium]|nr:class I SAM-dependent methyltransferase [Hyphomicrobiales bacterium]